MGGPAGFRWGHHPLSARPPLTGVVHGPRPGRDFDHGCGSCLRGRPRRWWSSAKSLWQLIVAVVGENPRGVDPGVGARWFRATSGRAEEVAWSRSVPCRSVAKPGPHSHVPGPSRSSSGAPTPLPVKERNPSITKVGSTRDLATTRWMTVARTTGINRVVAVSRSSGGVGNARARPERFVRNFVRDRRRCGTTGRCRRRRWIMRVRTGLSVGSAWAQRRPGLRRPRS
jgi:hypothetical protein